METPESEISNLENHFSNQHKVILIEAMVTLIQFSEIPTILSNFTSVMTQKSNCIIVTITTFWEKKSTRGIFNVI